MRRVSAFTLFVLIFAAGTFGQATPKESLLVLSKHDHTLAIVDPATLKVVAKMPVGEDPHEVIATADGKFAYASNYGGGGAGALHTLAVIDLVNQKALAPVDLGALRGPHGLDFAGGKVWFTAEAAKAVGSYDPSKNTIDWMMGTGQDRTHMMIVAPDLKKMYTTNVNGPTVSILEKSARAPGGLPNDKKGPPPGGGRGLAGPGGNWDQTVLTVGRGAEGFDVSPNGKE